MSNGFNWNQVLNQDEQAAAESAAPIVEAPTPAEPETEMVLDPRSGQMIEVPKPGSDGPKTELELEAAKILEEMENDPVKNYKPAYVDQSVHQIDVGDKRYAELDVAKPMQLEADAKPVKDAHIDDILRM